jgi:hypothetical protein
MTSVAVTDSGTTLSAGVNTTVVCPLALKPLPVIFTFVYGPAFEGVIELIVDVCDGGFDIVADIDAVAELPAAS